MMGRIVDGLLKIAAAETGLIPKPFDYLQTMTERWLHQYLVRDPSKVQQIVIVGAYYADEVRRLLHFYRNAKFTLYEPSPRYFEQLRTRYAHQERVKCFQLAVSDVCGEATFYETNLRGNGSLLVPNDINSEQYGIQQAESYTVRCATLDSHLPTVLDKDGAIDLIWCDVQGAELRVLHGAAGVLGRCRALFLEISIWMRMYDGACLLRELEDYLGVRGFTLVGLGTDPRNGTGNALFVHPERRLPDKVK
jgi:FkbM family methyltransferase